MERKEIAKAASQTEDAEKSLDLLRESYMSYKAQSTQQVGHRICHNQSLYVDVSIRYIKTIFTILSYSFFIIGLGIGK